MDTVLKKSKVCSYAIVLQTGTLLQGVFAHKITNWPWKGRRDIYNLSGDKPMWWAK